MNDYADRASEADFALDSDTVDGYHAQDLIDQIKALEARVEELETEMTPSFAELAALDRRIHARTYEALADDEGDDE